jgi:lipopolysaccharide export system permease protein
VLGGLLQRMIFKELLKVFLLALVALTGMLLLGGIFAEASRNGLTPSQILMIIPLLIPNFFPYTLPATTLFATSVIYGRLAHDNEILAVRAAGVNVLRAVLPGILLGVLASLATMFLYYRVIPQTAYLLRSKVMADLDEFLYSMLRREGRIVHPRLNYEIYVTRVEGRKLIGAQFMRRDPKDPQQYDLVARAREAELRVNMAKHQILVHMRDCQFVDKRGGHGTIRNDLPMDIPPDFTTLSKNRTSDRTWQELREERDKVEIEKKMLSVALAEHEAVLSLQNAPTNFAEHVRHLRNQIRQKEQEIREIEAEMHQRPALALGCLCFVLVGCPVGIWFSRSDYLSAFITCFLPIILIYYPLMLCGINFGRSGRASPILSMWLADALMVGISIFLYRKLLRH